ncbi:MAG: transcription termination/antitermination protein NusG [Anaerolineae bacterium]
MEQWYALHAKPKREHQVARILQQRGLQTFLPEIDLLRKKAPFFPGYLFVKVDFGAVGLRQIQWTPGLRRIVSFEGRPAVVPAEVIKLVRRKLGQAVARAAFPFKPGDPVRITGGPFKDMDAIFQGPFAPAERVQVLLHVLGRANRVQMAAADLQTAPSAPAAAPSKRPRRTRGRGRRISYRSPAGDCSPA